MLKRIITICCTSYTAVMILFALFSSSELAPEMDVNTVVQVFIITLSIALLMALSEKIIYRFDNIPLWADLLIRLVICYFDVFLLGVAFGWFPLAFSSLLVFSPVLLIVFVITAIILYKTCFDQADFINAQIKNRKK